MGYVVAALVLFPLSLLILLFGGRLFRSTGSVGYKDEKLEANQGAPLLVSNMFVAIVGGSGGMIIAYGITGSMLYAFLGLTTGYWAIKWLKEKQENDRRELLRSQYPDVLSQLESATYGNLNLYQALEDITPNLPRPARDIFYDILRRVRTGDNLATALEKTIGSTGWKELNGLLLGFKLSSSMGIDFGAICKHSLEAHYVKESARGQVKGAIAQNMLTLKLLSILPFFVIGAARAVAPDFTAPLFTTFEGNIFFFLCVIVILAGNVVSKRMVLRTLDI
ncbi:MAG: type II secretion system F family protein [Peptococcaceae bacterium]|nr:type II secretion system F family protein [Peptococcaceae bacterium]